MQTLASQLRRLAWLWIACYALFPTLALAKAVATITSEDGAWQAELSTASGPDDHGLEVNHVTSLTARITPLPKVKKVALGKSPTTHPILTGAVFDARMPAHKHGTAIKPKISAISEDTLKIDGVLLHMVGDWMLTLTVLGSDGKQIKFIKAIQL